MPENDLYKEKSHFITDKSIIFTVVIILRTRLCYSWSVNATQKSEQHENTVCPSMHLSYLQQRCRRCEVGQTTVDSLQTAHQQQKHRTHIQLHPSVNRSINHLFISLYRSSSSEFTLRQQKKKFQSFSQLQSPSEVNDHRLITMKHLDDPSGIMNSLSLTFSRLQVHLQKPHQDVHFLELVVGSSSWSE